MPDTEMVARRNARFAFTKFRPPRLPSTLVPRADLYARLNAAGSARLTLVSGSPGAGKSVLLASWAATRPASTTAWLSCDEADRVPLRFCFGLIEAVHTISAGFGADAAELLVMDGEPSADAVSLLVNDLAELPPGTAIVIDDFHLPAPGPMSVMDHLVERWPPTVQLVLASRSDPPLRLHRLRLTGELVELRDRDLGFSLDDTRQLLTNFDVELSSMSSAELHKRSEGWVLSLQMAALTLQVSNDPARALRALDLRTRAIAEYFVAEVLERQPKEVAAFMLDSSVLDELTPEVCRAVTEQVDAPQLLKTAYLGNLFVIAVDDERSAYRYHHLVRDVLRAELRALDPARQARLHTRAAGWFESIGEPRHAIRHLIQAGETDRAFQLLFGSVLPAYFTTPWPEQDFGLDGLSADLAGRAPEHILALSLELLLRGDVRRGAEYLELAEKSGTVVLPESMLVLRLNAVAALRDALVGQTSEAIQHGRAARSAAEESGTSDDWVDQLPFVLANVYVCLGDYEATERELEAARELPEWPRLGPPIQALALVEAGYVDAAAELADNVASDAARLGFDQHPSAAHYWRALARVAIERRDFDAAMQYARSAATVSERRRPLFEFLAHLDQAEIMSEGGHLNAALSEIGTARAVLPSGSPALLARADRLEALVLLALGDLTGAAQAAGRVPGQAGGLLSARLALARSEPDTASKYVGPEPPDTTPPRDRLMYLVLQAAIAIEQHRFDADDLVSQVVELAKHYGFVNSVVASTTQVTTCLLERSLRLNRSAYLDRLIAAAVQVRAADAASPTRRRPLVDPLTQRELNVLRLLPTSLSSAQIAATLFVSLNTVKTHLRRIYMKLDVRTRAEAVERAVELRLL